MEGMGNMRRGVEGEMDFFQAREMKKENPVKKLVEQYVFSENKEPDLTVLAEEEGRGHVYDKRDVKNEAQLCSWKKSLQEELLQSENMEEMLKRLRSMKGKYCGDFTRALQKEMQAKLPPSRYKEMTRMVEDEETNKMVPAHFLKAKESYYEMEKGMLREITAILALNDLPELGVEARIANSELDTRDKIDVIAYLTDGDKLENIVFAIQVKGNHDKKEGEAVEEVTRATEDPKKREFYKGSERFEKKLNRDNPSIKVIKIWLNISDNDIKVEGSGVDNNLKINIAYGLREVLKNYQK